MERVFKLLKSIPIDLGQETVANRTRGKVIAMEFAGNGRGKKALDIGCGKGRQSEILIKKGFDVISVDKTKQYEKCRTVDADRMLPFKDNSFDLVWASEVIEHLANVKSAINEFRRVLRPGGKMILTTPNSYFILMKPFYWLKYKPKDLQNKEHLHFFNYEDVRKLFPESAIYGYFPYFFIKFRIKYLAGLLSPTFIIIDKK
ncbi:class I SAM-dependent methyltransferase [Candidatus Parcubacteria bacterium]|nr:MAG: class I SAM-dependent methyltransferase [Candidatus Parcubacteria bacterium]